MAKHALKLGGMRYNPNLFVKTGFRKAPVQTASRKLFQKCMKDALTGKTYSSREAQRMGFVSAARNCGGRGAARAFTI